MVAYAPLIIDGFDHYNTAAAFAEKGWSGTPNFITGRDGVGRAFVTDNTTGSATFMYFDRFDSSVTKDHVLISCAFRMSGGANVTNLWRLHGGPTTATNTQWSLGTAGGVLQMRRGTTVIATGTTDVLTGQAWHWLEVKLLLKTDATGSYEVYLDGNLEMSGSGVQTTNGTVNGFGSQGSTSGSTATIDDLVIQDWSVAGVGYLGDSRVATTYPTAEGNYSAYTPSTGTDNSANVDDNPANGDTDYNSSTTPGDRDSFAHGALPTSGQVYMVQVTTEARKDDAGARSMKTFLRISGTDYDGTEQSLLTGYKMFREMYASNPAGGLWDESTVEAMEIGYKVQA